MSIKYSSWGFTLIELLIVVSIIGILSGIVYFTISGGTDEANKNVNSFNNSQIINELLQQRSLYLGDHEGFLLEIKKLVGDFPATGDRTKQAITVHYAIVALGSSFKGCIDQATKESLFSGLAITSRLNSSSYFYFAASSSDIIQCNPKTRKTVAFRVTAGGDIWYCGRFEEGSYLGEFFTARTARTTTRTDCRVDHNRFSSKCSTSTNSACIPFKDI